MGAGARVLPHLRGGYRDLRRRRLRFARTTWTTALLFGALFGFFAYATYDLSNLATLRGFTTPVALLDMAWGAC